MRECNTAQDVKELASGFVNTCAMLFNFICITITGKLIEISAKSLHPESSKATTEDYEFMLLCLLPGFIAVGFLVALISKETHTRSVTSLTWRSMFVSARKMFPC